MNASGLLNTLAWLTLSSCDLTEPIDRMILWRHLLMDAILRIGERKKWTDQDVRITAARLLLLNTISLAGPSLAIREAVRWTNQASGVGVFLHCHDRLRPQFAYLLLFEAFTLRDRLLTLQHRNNLRSHVGQPEGAGGASPQTLSKGRHFNNLVWKVHEWTREEFKVDKVLIAYMAAPVHPLLPYDRAFVVLKDHCILLHLAPP
ncbi:hypothetical protein EV127DRAFT_466162 [Xylaria flabelliformis]|nr:hypothetical protein EV127DRAFT_466162 [Xylaria flabelliformis]